MTAAEAETRTAAVLCAAAQMSGSQGGYTMNTNLFFVAESDDLVERFMNVDTKYLYGIAIGAAIVLLIVIPLILKLKSAPPQRPNNDPYGGRPLPKKPRIEKSPLLEDVEDDEWERYVDQAVSEGCSGREEIRKRAEQLASKALNERRAQFGSHLSSHASDPHRMSSLNGGYDNTTGEPTPSDLVTPSVSQQSTPEEDDEISSIVVPTSLPSVNGDGTSSVVDSAGAAGSDTAPYGRTDSFGRDTAPYGFQKQGYEVGPDLPSSNIDIPVPGAETTGGGMDAFQTGAAPAAGVTEPYNPAAAQAVSGMDAFDTGSAPAAYNPAADPSGFGADAFDAGAAESGMGTDVTGTEIPESGAETVITDPYADPYIEETPPPPPPPPVVQIPPLEPIDWNRCAELAAHARYFNEDRQFDGSYLLKEASGTGAFIGLPYFENSIQIMLNPAEFTDEYPFYEYGVSVIDCFFTGALQNGRAVRSMLPAVFSPAPGKTGMYQCMQKGSIDQEE